MLKEYLAEAKTSQEYAARWWACIIHDPYFDVEHTSAHSDVFFMPPIDDPSEEELVRFANELTKLIDNELNKTRHKQSPVVSEDNSEEFFPTPMCVMLQVGKRMPCNILREAGNNAGLLIPWWLWPSNINMRISRFHVEIQRHEISPWSTVWGELPSAIPPAAQTNSIAFIRGRFDK